MITYAIIMAREGSKRLPQKNILEIQGRTLIQHTIESALRCSLVERTIFSSDSKDYCELARSMGAEVLYVRPKELAQDESTDLEVLRDLSFFFQKNNMRPDLILHLRPTSPLRKDSDIAKAISLMNDSNISSVRSVRLSTSTPYKMYQLLDSGMISPVISLKDIESQNLPFQSLPSIYEHDGCIDVYKYDNIIRGRLSGENIHPLILDYSIDIDVQEDFVRARGLMDGFNF
jgi:N-acylneuraminate cytidylyltransferase